MEKLVLKFLDKFYVVKNGRFYTKFDDKEEWAYEIVQTLSATFKKETNTFSVLLQKWSSENGMTDEEWSNASGLKKLNVTWSPEAVQDLSVMCGIDDVQRAEALLVKELSEKVSREINTKVFKDIKKELNIDEFFSLMKCEGYEGTHSIYDTNQFSPRKYFTVTRYDEMLNERQNNTIWQDWVRTRGKDQETP